MAVVPHAGEEMLWAGNADTAISETADNYWVGPFPRLDVPDGDARYAHTEYGGLFEPICAAARLTAFDWPDPEGVKITAQVRLSGTWLDGNGLVILGFIAPTSGPGWPMLPFDRSGNFDQVLTDAGAGWLIVSVTLAPFSSGGWQPEAKAAAAAGALWVYAAANPGGDQVFDVSWISVETLGGYQPLRWRQRDDGLGVSGVKAARNVTSYQLGLGHRGYI